MVRGVVVKGRRDGVGRRRRRQEKKAAMFSLPVATRALREEQELLQTEKQQRQRLSRSGRRAERASAEPSPSFSISGFLRVLRT